MYGQKHVSAVSDTLYRSCRMYIARVHDRGSIYSFDYIWAMHRVRAASIISSILFSIIYRLMQVWTRRVSLYSNITFFTIAIRKQRRVVLVLVNHVLTAERIPKVDANSLTTLDRNRNSKY